MPKNTSGAISSQSPSPVQRSWSIQTFMGAPFDWTNSDVGQPSMSRQNLRRLTPFLSTRATFRTPLSKLRHVLAARGTHVIVGGEDGVRWTGGNRSQPPRRAGVAVRQATHDVLHQQREFIDGLVEMLSAGDMAPAIGGRAALDQTPDAIRAIEAGTISGKTVVNIGSEAS
ncbi:zinc-binding dehydrogenase [uncultured Ilumatobacter sp.]|uniref:zinc-binding dehydrogenase n=1 Tax=uncultured Ilumatobacter sp. TaxID=879968 RepID=UPI00374E570C